VVQILAYSLIRLFSAVWFKVAELGKTSDGKWAATDVLFAENSIYNFTIPEDLKAGQYLVRHELYEQLSHLSSNNRLIEPLQNCSP
jgi:hypothetical protein